MKKIIATLIVVLSLATSAIAQEQLSEVEKLKIEILNLRILVAQEQANSAKWISNYGSCQVQLLAKDDTLQQTYNSLKSEIHKNHPDFDFNMQTGVFVPKKKDPVEKK